jgi:hypothetical protein
MKTYPINNEYQHTADTAKRHKNPTIYGNKVNQHPTHIAFAGANQNKLYLSPFNIN